MFYLYYAKNYHHAAQPGEKGSTYGDAMAEGFKPVGEKDNKKEHQ
jgi:hypothetical protein